MGKQALADQLTPAQEQEFEQVLQSLQESKQQDEVVRIAADRQIESVGESTGLYAQKVEQVREVEGVRRILDEIQVGHTRMRGLIDELRSGKTYNSQELLAIQSEVYDLSINLQVSTKVLSEVVTNVKQLLTQQV